MRLTRTTILALIGLAYSLIMWSLPFILPEATVAKLVLEDSPPEYLGFLFFFIASLAFFGAFVWSTSGNAIGPIRTKRNVIFLALALIMFFGAAEEISWGQRIINFATPDFMEENEQEEFSIHNLPAFNSTNVSNLFQMNRMFIYFWFTLGLVIPLAAIASSTIRRWLTTWGIPIFPFIIGVQFLSNYILSKLYGPLGAVRDSYDGRITELRESEQAILFALIAIDFLLENWQARRKQEVSEVLQKRAA
jgi:hypothetical protein